MVTVDKYIRKLLFEQDCVIIPEFGGLLTHHVGAHFDAAHSVFQPARKRLAFNEILKIDDGVLTFYVAAHEKLPREEAINVVKRYVDSLRNDLHSVGRLEMDSIGTFSMNAEGKLVFEPDHSQNYNSDWFGMQSMVVRKAVRKELVQEDVEMTGVNAVDALTVPVEPANRRHKWVNWAAAAVFIGAVALLSALNTNTNNRSLLSTLNPFETVRDFRFTTSLLTSTPAGPVKEVLPPVTKPVPPVKKAPIEIVAYVPSHERQEEIPSVAVKQPTREELATIVKTPESAPTAAPTQPAKTANKYYLIAGSFGRTKNAEELKGQLIKKGFTESSVLASSPGRWVKVAVGSFATEEMALLQKKKVDAATGAQSWVFHAK